MEVSDAELMQRIQRTGDQDALGCLVDRHKHAIVNYLTRLSGDRDRAEDIAQDTFLRLYERAHQYQENGQLMPYIYRMATNLLRTVERTERRRRSLLVGLFNGHRPAPAPSPQAALLEGERAQVLQRAVSELPIRYREPLVLYEIEGWSYRDIAAAVGCREGTVKSRLNRGRQQLRTRLEAYHNGGSR